MLTVLYIIVNVWLPDIKELYSHKIFFSAYFAKIHG